MSKVLLIKPRYLTLEFPFITQPLGLLYIAATLNKQGHAVKIHDCAQDYKTHGKLKPLLENWQPDFIGISIIITEVDPAIKITKMIRETDCQAPIILGGPWPSANPDRALKILGADFVVRGEGEIVFPQLLEALNNQQPTESIPGVISLTNEKPGEKAVPMMTEKELNALPFPAWDLLNHELYSKKHSMPAVGRRKYMALITSRGCPYQCAYCFHAMGNTYRKRHVQSILDEIEGLLSKHGYKEFEIIDDCFNLDRDRTQKILIEIQRRFPGVRLHFPNGLRADVLEPEDAELFKNAGTVSAAFCIETASLRLQKMIRKNMNIEKALLAINAFVDAGIYTTGAFMLGFPTETYEEALKTVEFACHSKLHRAMFLMVTPFAGTELFDRLPEDIKHKNTITQSYNMNYYNNNLNISAMSDKELRRVFQKAYRRFYLNPRKIFRILKNHPQVTALPYYAFSILRRAITRD